MKVLYGIITIFCKYFVVTEGLCRSNQFGEYVYSKNYGNQWRNFEGIVCESYQSPKDLTEVFSGSYDLKYLMFQNSSIDTIYLNFCSSFESVMEIYMNSSSVVHILPGAFKGTYQLKKLYLNDNNIQKISSGMFNYLGQLQFMNLSNNAIEIIESFSLVGLANLETIDLSHNLLKILYWNEFQLLHSLKYINLSYNYLNDTPNISLSNLPLMELDLSFNNIKEFGLSTFASTLTSLKLKSNLLAEIKPFFCSDETYHSLNQTHIANGIGKIFLDLSCNRINQLSSDCFRNCSQLHSLQLQNNSIEDIPFGTFNDLEDLENLNLSNNRLKNLYHGIFSHLYNLTVLDISRNQLSVLDETVFYPLQNLQELNIAYNLIWTINSYDLLRHCPKLVFVELNGNEWNCKLLTKILQTFSANNVSIKSGTRTNEFNINGIACSSEVTTESNRAIDISPQKTPSKSIEKNTESIENALKSFNFTISFFSKQLEVLDQILKNFSTRNNFDVKSFDTDFKRSEFYNFFTKELPKFQFKNLNLNKAFNSDMLDNQFKNTNFYKFFTSDFTKSEFFKYTSNLNYNNFTVAENSENLFSSAAVQALKQTDENQEDTSNNVVDAINKFKSDILIFMSFMVLVFLCVCAVTYYYVKFYIQSTTVKSPEGVELI